MLKTVHRIFVLLILGFIVSVLADNQNEDMLKRYLPGYPFGQDSYPNTSCSKLASCDAKAGKLLAPKPNVSPLPPNGCGPHFSNIKVPQFDFGSCCNMHDYCYGQCNSHVTFELCNQAFISCMNDVCNGENFIEKWFCNLAAKSYGNIVSSDAACAVYTGKASDYCICM